MYKNHIFYTINITIYSCYTLNIHVILYSIYLYTLTYTYIHYTIQYIAYEKVIIIFLQHGGNPNTLNGRLQTSLHSICLNNDQTECRLRILNILLQWHKTTTINKIDTAITNNNNNTTTNKSDPTTANNNSNNNNDSIYETVSINRVDSEGNGAIHYAALNGLELCVVALIEAGAILALVNQVRTTIVYTYV